MWHYQLYVFVLLGLQCQSWRYHKDERGIEQIVWGRLDTGNDKEYL
jgi:hypothetical protein